ncbi:MAG: MAC/Perforin domain protein [Candidatus Xenolissoclinum pacificiensis L6]|uniref:MAC/Perforin domain protein n=1 Tax=Candidatus Xenolissoclinum pacificiensis L6 TaxID=1401685 RepID=W2V0J6_9RICK|nr:MAG: MAC/Perforin domain protein [Candidatus Xenolissoclinum pacificiensis L6]
MKVYKRDSQLIVIADINKDLRDIASDNPNLLSDMCGEISEDDPNLLSDMCGEISEDDNYSREVGRVVPSYVKDLAVNFGRTFDITKVDCGDVVGSLSQNAVYDISFTEVSSGEYRLPGYLQYFDLPMEYSYSTRIATSHYELCRKVRNDLRLNYDIDVRSRLDDLIEKDFEVLSFSELIVRSAVFRITDNNITRVVPLQHDFVQDVMQLDINNIDTFKNFVLKYGTHYVTRFSIGGSISQMLRISPEEVASMVYQDASFARTVQEFFLLSEPMFGDVDCLSNCAKQTHGVLLVTGGRDLPERSSDGLLKIVKWMSSIENKYMHPIMVEVQWLYILLNSDYFPDDPDILVKGRMLENIMHEYVNLDVDKYALQTLDTCLLQGMTSTHGSLFLNICDDTWKGELDNTNLVISNNPIYSSNEKDRLLDVSFAQDQAETVAGKLINYNNNIRFLAVSPFPQYPQNQHFFSGMLIAVNKDDSRYTANLVDMKKYLFVMNVDIYGVPDFTINAERFLWSWKIEPGIDSTIWESAHPNTLQYGQCVRFYIFSGRRKFWLGSDEEVYKADIGNVKQKSDALVESTFMHDFSKEGFLKIQRSREEAIVVRLYITEDRKNTAQSN